MNRQRALMILAAATVAVVVMVIGLSPKPGQADEASALPLFRAPKGAVEGKVKATADHEAIFKRAFWRRPAAGDRILHAELSEWSDGVDVSRWQWSIEVEPSPELKRWLQERNPFSLAASDTRQLSAGATAPPAWFPDSAEDYEIHRSADGRMSLLVGKRRNVLFATASGFGFSHGVAEPVQPLVKIESTGRLPLTSPPNPIASP